MTVKEFISQFNVNRRIIVYPTFDIKTNVCYDLCESYIPSIGDYTLLAFSCSRSDRETLNNNLEKNKARITKKHIFTDYIYELVDDSYDLDTVLNSTISGVSTSYVGHGGGHSYICLMIEDVKLKGKHRR